MELCHFLILMVQLLLISIEQTMTIKSWLRKIGWFNTHCTKLPPGIISGGKVIADVVSRWNWGTPEQMSNWLRNKLMTLEY